MMKPLVSVVIPVYNGEKEIENAIRSALDPNLSQEILVVDDGSKDQTAATVLRLGEEISCLRLIPQENSGPAAARNRGIDEAKGEYIVFLDSDDAFCQGALARALSVSEGKDLTVFGYVLEQNGKGTVYCAEDGLLSSAELWRGTLPLLYRLNMINQVWAKVFSARLLKENNIRFPHCKWGEDRLFLFEALEKAESVAVSKLPLCRYIQRQGSLISRFLADKAKICLEIDTAVRGLGEMKGGISEEGEKIYTYMYVKSLLSSFVTLFAENCSLSLGKKLCYVKEALDQKTLPSVNAYPADCGFSFRVLAFLAHTKISWLNLFAAWGVRLASRMLPRLFVKAKHAYNKETKE